MRHILSLLPFLLPVMAQPVTAASCSPTTGPQSYAILMVTFPSTPLPANVTPSFVQNLFFGAGRTVDGYVREASYNNASLAGGVFGPFQLDADYDTVNQTSQILDAAIRAADTTVDFRNYQHIVIFAPSSAAFGFGTIGCIAMNSPSKGPFNASAMWLYANSNTTQDVLIGVAVDEFGHNLGLSHAGTLDYGDIALGPDSASGAYNEFGDFYSAMSGLRPTTPSNVLITGHYAAPHKSQLGWLTGSILQQVSANTTITLAPYESAGDVPKVLRVRRGSTGNQWLWLEYRQPIGSFDSRIQVDNPQVLTGLMIHYEDPANSSLVGFTVLLDFTPNSQVNDFGDAALAAGSVWQDPSSNLTIVVGTASPTGIDVTVLYSGCSTLPSAGATFPAAATGGSIAVSAAPACSWSASTRAPWITLSGPASGSGNGAVNLTLAANPSTSARNGIVIVDGRVFTVTQSGNSPPALLPISPNMGVGQSQTFVASVYDANGFADIASVQLLLNSALDGRNASFVIYSRPANAFYLVNDAGTGSTVFAAAGPVAQNSQCSLLGARISAPDANTLSLTVTLAFKPAFAGMKTWFINAQDSVGGSPGYIVSGSWVVTGRAVPQSVAPATSSGSAQDLTFTIADVAGAGDVASVSVLINANLDGRNACFVYFDRAASAVYLINDPGTGSTPASLGAQVNVQNSQCSLDAARSSSTGTGSLLSLTLSLSFKAGFAGAKSIFVAAQDAAGSLSPLRPIGATQITAGPGVLSVAPDAGAGLSQVFSITFSAPGGFANISSTAFLVNGAPDGRNACFVAYDRASNAAFLINDAATASIRVDLGTPASAQNSQCRLNGSGSSATGSGVYLTLNLSLDFFQAFASTQPKLLYVSAQSPAGSVLLQQRGAYAVKSGVGALSVLPNLGSNSSQIFRLTVADGGGAANIASAMLLMNVQADGANACAVLFDRATNALYLINDAGNNSTRVDLGSMASAQNTQCVLNGAGSSVSAAGALLYLDLALQFRTAFTGPKQVFGFATNNAGNSGLPPLSTWIVP